MSWLYCYLGGVQLMTVRLSPDRFKADPLLYNEPKNPLPMFEQWNHTVSSTLNGMANSLLFVVKH